MITIPGRLLRRFHFHSMISCRHLGEALIILFDF
jgi:hypothetical protein